MISALGTVHFVQIFWRYSCMLRPFIIYLMSCRLFRAPTLNHTTFVVMTIRDYERLWNDPDTIDKGMPPQTENLN